jgi:peptidoglycan hydrolase CwlO-like protein
MKVSLEKVFEENNLCYSQNITAGFDKNDFTYKNYPNDSMFHKSKNEYESKIMNNDSTRNSYVSENDLVNKQLEKLNVEINNLNIQLKALQGSNNELNMKIREVSDQTKTCI